MKNLCLFKPLSVILLMTIFMCSCNNELHDWEKAIKENSIKEYKTFLAKYPTSGYSIKANSVIDSIAWSEAMKGDSIECYHVYLQTCPSGKKVNEAQQIIEEFNIPTEDPGYCKEVKEFAKSNIYFGMSEEAVYKDVVISNVHYKYIAFIELFPNSNYAKEIRKKVSKFRAHSFSSDLNDSTKSKKIFISTEVLKMKYGYNGVRKIFKWDNSMSGSMIGYDGIQVFFGHICLGNLQLLSGEFSPTIKNEKEGFLFQKGSKILYSTVNK